MKNIVIKGVVLLIVLVIFIYVAMLLDTNKLMSRVKSAFRFELSLEETKGDLIDRYNFRKHFSNRDVGEIRLSIYRVYCIHNFKRGRLLIHYYYVAYDTDGKIITGSKAFSNWEIQKEDGEWRIIDIEERP